MKRSLVLVGLLLVSSLAVAQYAPRPDDHFWRKKVILVLDLREKINEPLVKTQSGSSYVKGSDKRFGTRTQGMINALVEAWQQGKFTAYKADGDSLHRSLTFSEFYANVQKLNGGPAAEATPAETSEEPTEGGEEDFGDFEGDELSGDEAAPAEEGGDGVATASTNLNEFLGNLTYRMELVEDRIFDKGRGVMVHDIEYIRLIWVDPDGKTSDRNVVAFKYDDILSVLEETQWKNRFNDAEDRSIREIFDQRLFNGTVASVGLNTPNTLKDADRRRVQMIEFEHHLWSY